MKKLFLTLALLCGVYLLPTYAQDYHGYQDRYHHQHHDNGRHNGWYKHDYSRHVYTVTEYRYVRYRDGIYRETYRSRYRDNFLLSRYLVDRERVNYYDDRNIRFNVFLRF